MGQIVSFPAIKGKVEIHNVRGVLEDLIGLYKDLATTLISMQSQSILRDSKIMAGLTDIQTAQAAEHADLATLTTLITQLLTAFANGNLSPTDAQALLTQITTDDSTVKSSITAITAALPPSTPPPAA